VGGCTFAKSTWEPWIPFGPFQPCRDLFPGRACASYPGVLNLTFAYNGSLPFIEPDFRSNLNAVGLGAITAVWQIHLHIIHLVQIPRDIRPSFLPGITMIKDQLAVYECTIEGDDTVGAYLVCGREPNDPGPSTPRLVGLPDVANVDRVRDLYIQNTGFADMTSLGGLRCSPDIIQLYGNEQLGSLQGLEGIAPWTRDNGGNIIVFIPTPTNISALRTFARCDEQGNSELQGGFVSLQLIPGCSNLRVRPMDLICN
jgi:hypothetical protein